MQRIFILCLLGLLSLSSVNSPAQLHVEVTGGSTQPMPIALVPLETSTLDAQEQATLLLQIIQKDLECTGLFKIVPSQAFLQQRIPFHVRPNFSDWRLLKVQAVVNGYIEKTPTGYKVGFRLWDIFTQTLLESFELETTEKFWRRLGHKVADLIYSKLTGEAGYFDTRILYVAETGDQKNRKKRLAIMDQDGHNHHYITGDDTLVLTPRFDQRSQRVAYLSYETKVPRVYILDLETGKHTLVGNFPGITFAPRFSPDGKAIVMSQMTKKNSYIYEMDLATKKAKKLTNFPSLDTSPCYSPDGNKIIFNSDRGGSKQLYMMDRDGKNAKRISFGGGVYSTPVWSPRGDLIAFTKVQGGQFYIGVMDPNGKNERLLATGFVVEGPSWAPNGRTLMFGRQEKSNNGKAGPTNIYSIDITGYNERRMPTPGDASDPAWSPPLPVG